MSDKVYVCKSSFATEYDGAPIVVTKGQRVREGHDLIKGNPDAFELADEGHILEVETATNQGPTVKELRAELKARNVQVPKRAEKDKLEQLLAEAKQADEGQTEEPDEGQSPEPEGNADDQETETPVTEGDQGDREPDEGDSPET